MAFTERMRKSVFEGGLHGTAKPAFRRVHYEWLAKEIALMPKGERLWVSRHFQYGFRDVPGFDRARFERACKVR